MLTTFALVRIQSKFFGQKNLAKKKQTQNLMDLMEALGSLHCDFWTFRTVLYGLNFNLFF